MSSAPHPVSMRLQRVVARRVGDKTYYKWQAALPPALIEDLGWQPGDELEVEAKNGRLILRRA